MNNTAGCGGGRRMVKGDDAEERAVGGGAHRANEGVE